MKNRGYFGVIMSDGEQPTEEFGEMIEIIPAGFKGSVSLALYRIATGGTHQAVHFPTGKPLRKGMTRETAIDNADKFMQGIGEEDFRKWVDNCPIINTALKSSYQGDVES